MLLPVACGGCIHERQGDSKLDLGVDPSVGALADSSAYRDTVGALTFYEGLLPLRVRGYGLVMGLGGKGSRDCPPHVYKRLVQNLYKRYRFSGEAIGDATTTPEEWIHDDDTAVVLVEGAIPPGAAKGSRFDLHVRALPGTQTKSLRGGRLFGTELEIFRSVSPNLAIMGRILARGSGPLFLNPFAGEDSATVENPLKAVVVAGGTVGADRRVRLVLLEPSYRVARRIQTRINTRFPGPRRVADATSPSYVQIRIPRAYQADVPHFLALLRALYRMNDPVFESQRARMLAAEIIEPSSPHAQIALAFEGLGQAALPVLDGLYTHVEDYVSFHAAVAGLRLEDHVAADVMTAHAEDAGCPFRYQAIRALTGAGGMAGAAMTLRRLLHDDDPRVQVAAYEGLLERKDPAVASVRIGGDNFMLDQVATDRPGFVYVKRSGARRVALFGRGLRCSPPVLYRAPDGSLTISAGVDDDVLTVVRFAVSNGSMSPPVSVKPALPGFLTLLGSEAEVGYDGEVAGLGVEYGAVARALYRLCRDGSINATFILEQPNASEMFGPARPVGRPESEFGG